MAGGTGCSEPKGAVADGIEELLGQADGEGQIESEVEVEVTASLPPPEEAVPSAPSTPGPVVLEFMGKTKSGAPFKGVLLSVDQDVGNVDFKGPMRIAAQAIEWGGVTVLRGFAAAPETDANGGYVATRKWTFLGVPVKATLPTLPQPVAFDFDAQGAYLIFCQQDVFYGAANFERPRTETKLPAVLVARRNVPAVPDGEPRIRPQLVRQWGASTNRSHRLDDSERRFHLQLRRVGDAAGEGHRLPGGQRGSECV